MDAKSAAGEIMGEDTKVKDFIEKRRYRRFRLRRPAFVVFAAGPPRLREVLDLGMGGLAVSFVDEGAGLPRGPLHLSLISRIRGNEPEEYLSGLDCRIVSEQALHELPPTQLHRRRYGIEIVDLTPLQRRRLALFLLANAEKQM